MRNTSSWPSRLRKCSFSAGSAPTSTTTWTRWLRRRSRYTRAWRGSRGARLPRPRMNISAIEVWAGVECTLNRVGNEWHDQIERSGHARRESDLDLFAGLGIRTLRYPILWERVAPLNIDAPDWSWTDARLARLRALGINPIAGLVHHGSGPAYTSLLDPAFPRLLAR